MCVCVRVCVGDYKGCLENGGGVGVGGQVGEDIIIPQ